MRTPGHDFELAAGWLVHEGLVTAPATHHRLLHRRGPDRGAGVQRGHGDPRRAARPGPRPPARRARGSSACGVCGKDSIDEVLAAPAVGRWSGPLAGCGRRTPPPGPAARGPDRLRPHRRGARGRRWSPPTATSLVVREDVGRHNAVDKVTGARVAGRAVPRGGVPGGQRPGRASSWSRRRWPPASGALVAVGAPTSAGGPAGPRGRARRSTASPPASGPSGTPEDLGGAGSRPADGPADRHFFLGLTLNTSVDGVGSALPAGCTARTVSVCLPTASLRLFTVSGLVQGL